MDTEILAESGIDKIDLLLAIDNSSSMADKQQILAAAIPQLVTGLLNPPCIDPSTGAPGTQPANPATTCPTRAANARSRRCSTCTSAS